MTADSSPVNFSTVFAFTGYLFGVLVLAVLAHRFQKRGNFLREYFLSGRELGPWTLAFSFAATHASAGSFMGFPSLIYRYGWVLALFVSGYIVLPLMTMGFFGKRLNQVARRLGSITIPDLLRDRYSKRRTGCDGRRCDHHFSICVHDCPVQGRQVDHADAVQHSV